MSFVDNYTGTAEQHMRYPRIAAINSGVAIRVEESWESHTAFSAHSVATGERIWYRNGSEDIDNRALTYRILKAHDGKLLVWVQAWTRHVKDYAQPAYVDDVLTDNFGTSYDVHPVATSWHEVIDITDGETLARVSLNTGTVEHIVPCITGSLGGAEIAYEDRIIAPLSEFSIGAQQRWDYQASGGGWWEPSAINAVTILNQPGVTNGVYPGLSFETSTPEVLYSVWGSGWAFDILDGARPIPPHHSDTSVCVSTDGNCLVFAPRPTPTADDYYTLYQEGETGLVDVPLGDPFTDGHPSVAGIYNWDLELVATVNCGVIDQPGQPIAVGSSVLLPYYSWDDGAWRYHRINPATGSTVAITNIPATVPGVSTLANIITTKSRLVQIKNRGALVLNYPAEP